MHSIRALAKDIIQPLIYQSRKHSYTSSNQGRDLKPTGDTKGTPGLALLLKSLPYPKSVPFELQSWAICGRKHIEYTCQNLHVQELAPPPIT